MIEIGKFAKRMEHIRPPKAGEPANFLRFSLDPDNTSNELRRFADAIDHGQIILQKVQTGGVASLADWCAQAVLIEFVEIEN